MTNVSDIALKRQEQSFLPLFLTLFKKADALNRMKKIKFDYFRIKKSYTI